jgi:hypothetical protein
MFARKASFLLGAALVAAAVTPPVKADQWDKKTVITITEPVQVPSCCNDDHVVVLQPGTYRSGSVSGDFCLRVVGRGTRGGASHRGHRRQISQAGWGRNGRSQ